MGRTRPVVEIKVTVLGVESASVRVSKGTVEASVSFEDIDDESEIDAYSEEGDAGTLIIPKWKAKELGLI